MSANTKNLSSQADAIQYIGVTLLGIVFLPVLAFSLSLALRLGEARWTLAAAGMALSPLLCHLALKSASPRARLAAWTVPFCLTAVAFTLCGWIYDTSYDGMTYHTAAVLGLLAGYNPYYSGLHAPYDFWVDHYPKATWYFAAVVARATGDYQCGKSYHMLLAFVVFFYAYDFFRRRQLAGARPLLLAAAAAANPVAINQMFSYYVDGALGSLLTLLIFSILNLIRAPVKADRIVFVMAGCLFINVKLSAIAYMAALCLVALCFLLYRSRQQLSARIADVGAVLCIGLLAMGYNPYITNTISNGNPMYPLYGKGSINVITAQSPALFNRPDGTGIGRLALSVMGKTANISEHTGGTPEVKLPFSVQASELAAFTAVDVRIGGWGVLMGGIMLLSLLLYCARRGWKDGESITALALTALTILINPYAWWARFAPQVALIPVFLIAPSAASPGRRERLLAGGIAWLLLVNSLLILIPNVTAFHNGTKSVEAQLSHAVQVCGKGAYDIYGATEFHYEQFTEPYGIIIKTPRWEENGKKPIKGLLPLREIFVYKKGCNVNAE